MRRLIRKKHHYAKTILFLICIAALSFVGVSYASWNSQMEILTSVTTGFLDVYFNGWATNSEGLQISLDDAQRLMLVEGIVEESMTEVVTQTEEATIITADYSDYEGSFDYSIADAGSADAQLAGKSIQKDDSLVLEETVGEDDRQQIRIKAGEGVYNFEIELQYTNKP
ncbi:MAG: hypothetical protein GX115_08270 [Ruminiclostridium sp.]|nr:hypothetical protein [Ruminiclostridium sp.]